MKSDSPDSHEFDVVIVGGGPAGCSAAVFTARYGLDTTVFDRGNSSIQQCAFIENYLGFPGGIDIETFYAMSQSQAARFGAKFVDEMVVEITQTADGFQVETQDGIYTADRVIAASTYDVSYLESVLGEHFLADNGETWLDPDLAGERGETPVEGLRLAGPIGGVESQIAVAVGHGARVGIGLIEDHRRTREDIWDGSASYTDWVVQHGRYAGEEWLETMTELHLDAAPDHLDEDIVRARARELAERQQDQQIEDSEVDRRTERAQRQLLEYVDDAIIREYLMDFDGAEMME